MQSWDIMVSDEIEKRVPRCFMSAERVKGPGGIEMLQSLHLCLLLDSVKLL